MTPEQKQAVLDELASGRHDDVLSGFAYQLSGRGNCSTEFLMVAAYYCDVVVGESLARLETPGIPDEQREVVHGNLDSYREEGDRIRARIAARRKETK